MPLTQGLASDTFQDITTTAEEALNLGAAAAGIAGVIILTDSANTQPVQVNIPALHGATRYVPIPPGREIPFLARRGMRGEGGIRAVNLKSVSGTQKVAWGVVSG